MFSRFFISFLIISLYSCGELTVLDLDRPDRQVIVDAIISTDSTWVVDLYYSQLSNVFTEPIPVENAIITIDAEGNSDTESVFRLDDNGLGNYTFGTPPIEGKYYNMTIEVDGQIITAQTYVPKVIFPKVKIIETITDTIKKETSVSLELDLDENGFNKYYAYDIEVVTVGKIKLDNDSNDNNPNPSGDENADNESVNTNFTSEDHPKFGAKFGNLDTAIPLTLNDNDSGTITVEYTRDSTEEELIESTTGIVRPPADLSDATLKYRIKIWSISYDYYQFLTTVNSTSNYSSEVRVGNTYSNITNGLGIFAGYNYKELEEIIK